MKMEDTSPTDEIFTHIDPHDGEVRHFNATVMARIADEGLKCGAAQLVNAAFDDDYMEFCKTGAGLEQWKLDRLVEPYLSMPIIGIKMYDGSVLMVDGHHRMMKHWLAGARTYKIVIFRYEVLDHFLVEMPKGFSEFMASEVLAQNTEEETLMKVLRGEVRV